MPYRILFVFLLLSFPLCAQVSKKIRQYDKVFQFSLFPGISTNGISSGSYDNDYSLNLFGGLSAGNNIFELGLITNANLRTTTGIQIAGLANIVGANTFLNLSLYEERELINVEDFEVNRTGIQMAGFLNFVLNHTRGIQATGGLNVVGNDFRGLQLAGLGNSAGGTTLGFQLSGLYNISYEAVGGFQVTGLFNYAGGQLAGMQLGLINKALRLPGKKSTPPTRARGMQLGLMNMAKDMHGLQVGLIYFGGAMRGKQIGLINFFEKQPSKERVRMGTPIGLLNFGSKGSYFRINFNELYTINAEYTTGNCLNCSHVLGSEMPFDDRNQIFNQNALIAGYDPAQETWGFGYGFQKVLYNKATIMPSPLNKRRVITYGIRLMHLNRSLSLDRTFNLLSRVNIDYGKRWRSLYGFIGISFNYFMHDPKVNVDDYGIRTVTMDIGKSANVASVIWPGYAVGLQF
jgi:hypothetical protein